MNGDRIRHNFCSIKKVIQKVENLYSLSSPLELLRYENGGI